MYGRTNVYSLFVDKLDKMVYDSNTLPKGGAYVLKTLRRNFERFCYRHRGHGIPNLMLWIAIGKALVYMLTMIDPSAAVYRALAFSRSAILEGQVWRLFSYILLPDSSNVLFLAIMLFFYYQIGRIMESHWGIAKFNIFYFSGILLTDIAAMALGVSAGTVYLDMSLILSFATLMPENQVLLFFIIPLKMKYLAWFYFAWTAFEVIFGAFPYNLFPIIALLNYFLYFGKDILQVLPDFLTQRLSFHRRPRQQRQQRQQPNADWASGYQAASGQKPYHHKCTVCGRTDTEYPGLEFRYCSQCNGYYCYCMDHINNHVHIK